MNKRNTLLRFLVPVVILIVISLASFYLYKKNSVPRPLTKQEIEEQQRKDLMSYTIDPASQKSEAEQKKELEQFTVSPSTGKLTEEEMRKALTSQEVKP